MKTRQTNSENGMTLSSGYCVAKSLVHDHYTEIPGKNCNLHIFWLASVCDGYRSFFGLPSSSKQI